jgi:predicted lipoprotein with Yx(FWY)xxD motif
MKCARALSTIRSMDKRTRHNVFAATALVPLVAMAVAGCGGGNSSQATAATPKTSSGAAATVGVASNDSLGKILVDSRGRTVYLFQKDTGSTSTCSGECAVDWPPVTAKGKPTAGDGVSASKLGTTKRSDGSEQVTYDSHPLYRYQGDQSAGDANGQGLTAFGAAWYVVSPAGSRITTASSGGSSPGY